jgi:hypothetical protein
VVDFRYHLVSILAVFLALAVGIVLGTSTIDKVVLDDLRQRVDNLTDSNEGRRVENAALTKQLKDDGEFAKAVLPVVVAGRLAGQRVIVVSAPGADKGATDGVGEAVVKAGGTVAGRLQVQDKLADPAAQSEIDDLMNDPAVLPDGLQLPSGSPVERAAAVVAAVVATQSGDSSRPSSSATPGPQAQAVFSAFKEAGLLRVVGDPPLPASLFVVVAPEPPATATPEADAKVAATNEVVAALADKARAVVVAAPAGGAEPGGVVAAVRRDGTLSAEVSSVDGADTSIGQVAVVFALVERTRGGFGHYGTGPAADGPLPDIAKLS